MHTMRHGTPARAHTRLVCVSTYAHAHTYACADQEWYTHTGLYAPLVHTLSYTGVVARFTAEEGRGGGEGRGWFAAMTSSY